MKYFIIVVVVIVLVLIGFFFFIQNDEETIGVDQENDDVEMVDEEGNDEESEARATEVMGESVEGRDIVAYNFGEGDTKLLFVGGIHGGYSWNTSLLAYELIDHLEENSDLIPENVSVTVIPTLNPDGLYKIVGKEGRFSRADVPSGDRTSGRFNASGVDLNRNFDCSWQANATWRDISVDAGSGAFSEPESQALRNYVEANNISAAVVWYSAAGGVFTSSCNGPVLSETQSLVNVFANASGYPASGSYDAYLLTGDATDWLAKMGIPAISVLLDTHSSIEWGKNRAGIEAVLNHYSN